MPLPVRTCSFVCALSLLATGCRALDRDRYRALLDAGTEDGASATCTGTTDGGAPEGGCALALVPPRSAGTQDVGTDAGVRVFGMHRLTFGFASSSVWRFIGFDRDGYCTNPATSPTQGCRPLPGATPVEDGEGGRDDSFATQIGSLFATLAFDEPRANEAIAIGRRTIGARLIGLGGPDDPQVIVEWFPVMRGTAADGTSPPQWDGHDRWAIDARLAYDPTSPGTALIRSNTGYTTCGTLVARIPSRMPIRFATTDKQVRLTLSNGIMAGPVDPLGQSLGPLDFSALWATTDALLDLGVLGVCPPTDGGISPTWNLASQLLEGSADVMATGESSPATRCDAISVAFRAEFVPIDLRPDESTPAVPEDLCGR